ncbi:MAG TPA: hypothetical protein VJ001_10620 [Rhodocyclaceae bacterium]|nr:hypothetical protein [Rhodocyclaceae bacterium]
MHIGEVRIDIIPFPQAVAAPFGAELPLPNGLFESRRRRDGSGGFNFVDIGRVRLTLELPQQLAIAVAVFAIQDGLAAGVGKTVGGALFA